MKEKWKEALESAIKFRSAHLKQLQESGTNCYRLFSGTREGIPGLVIEVFGETAIFQQFVGQEAFQENELKEIAEEVLSRFSLRSVQLKKFIEDRSSRLGDEDLLPKTPLTGQQSEEAFTVKENGLSFEIRPFDGFSAGLFLDQRENRKFIQSQARGKKVLNAFAYTCGFSVSAAKGGGSVTSVDLSQKYLNWGKRNFELNGLDPASHRFYAWDIFEYLKKTKKQEERFDLIILDPPSFSRSKQGTFSLKKDWEKLLEVSLHVLSPQGLLFYSCNYFEWDQTDWGRNLDKAMGPFAFHKLTLPETPLDFKKEEHPLKTWAISLQA